MELWNSKKKHNPKSGQISSRPFTAGLELFARFSGKLGILTPKSVKQARFSIVNIAETDSQLDIKIPIGSMYGIFTYIYHKHSPNVGEYTICMDPIWNIH